MVVALTVNEKLLDRAVQHAIHLHRLQTSEADKAITFLNSKVFPDLLGKLRTRLDAIEKRGFDTGPATTERLKRIILQMRETISAGITSSRNGLKESLGDLAMTEAEFQIRLVRNTVPVDLSFEMPSTQTLNSLLTSRPMEGQFLNDWFSDLTRRAQGEIEGVLRIGIAEGQTTADIVRALEGTAAAQYDDGAFGGIRRNVETVVRTAANHVTTHAREATYQANEDLVKGVQLIETLDTRTCEQCMAMDGKMFDVGEGPRPPFHPNCRGTTAPVLRSLRELGLGGRDLPESTRAAASTAGFKDSELMNGQIPEKITYGQWLRRQPSEVQDDVLGPTRAKLFRGNRVRIDRFVNDRGRVLTLPELRRREGLPA